MFALSSISVGVRAFVIGLSQIASFLSPNYAVFMTVYGMIETNYFVMSVCVYILVNLNLRNKFRTPTDKEMYNLLANN